MEFAFEAIAAVASIMALAGIAAQYISQSSAMATLRDSNEKLKTELHLSDTRLARLTAMYNGIKDSWMETRGQLEHDLHAAQEQAEALKSRLTQAIARLKQNPGDATLKQAVRELRKKLLMARARIAALESARGRLEQVVVTLKLDSEKRPGLHRPGGPAGALHF